jgi:hypothetical protein
MRIFGFFIVLMLVPALSHGVQVDGLYKAIEPVATQSAAERKAAITRAISGVAHKVSGRRGVLNNAALQHTFQYIQPKTKKEPLQVEITFQKAAIDRALQQFDIPVWGANRPAIAVWLAVDNGNKRYLIGEGATKTAALLQAVAFQSGLPIVLPLLDLQDQQAVQFNDVWGLFSERIVQASQRYGAKQVLFGRLLKEQGGGWKLRWALVNADGKFEGETRQTFLSEAFRESLNSSSELLADIYAPRGNAHVSEVTLMVEGIANLGEFSRISQYLSSLDVVRKVSWQRVNAGKASFVLDMAGDAQGLKEQIALNNVLEETYRAGPVIPIQRGGEQILNQQVMPYAPRQILSFRVR